MNASRKILGSVLFGLAVTHGAFAAVYNKAVTAPADNDHEEATSIVSALIVPVGYSVGTKADCPPGKIAINGSVTVNNSFFNVEQSGISADGRGWVGKAVNVGLIPDDVDLKVSAACVNSMD